MSAFVVAEAGVNHMGDRQKMLALCDAAKNAGADAVKFQAYDWEKLCRRRDVWLLGEEAELLRRCQLGDGDLDAIAAHCKRIGIKWFASVFDPSQVDRVLSRDACTLKIGHAEADYEDLAIACKRALPNGPIWISNRPDPWTHAVASFAFKDVLCIAEYPAKAPPGLNRIKRINGYYTGFSSHYADWRIPAAAALRGAEYIEAHLMLGSYVGPVRDDKTLYTTDEPEREWSLSPEDFGKMVKQIREHESWL